MNTTLQETKTRLLNVQSFFNKNRACYTIKAHTEDTLQEVTTDVSASGEFSNTVINGNEVVLTYSKHSGLIQALLEVTEEIVKCELNAVLFKQGKVGFEREFDVDGSTGEHEIETLLSDMGFDKVNELVWSDTSVFFWIEGDQVNTSNKQPDVDIEFLTADNFYI